MKNTTRYGQNAQEYAVVFGLVILVAVGALSGMSGQMAPLFNGLFGGQGGGSATGAKASGGGVNQLLGLVSTHGGSSSSSQGAVGMIIDPTTDQMRMVSSGDGLAASSTTSQEGKTVNTGTNHTFSTLKIAGALEDLAHAQTDPAARDYINQIAYYAYYMGGAEGELDDINGLERPSDYSNADALVDLLGLRKKLNTLMSSPKGEMSPETLMAVKALTREVDGIAGEYITALGPMIDANGDVPRTWSNDVNCEAKQNCKGGGEPGTALKSAMDTTFQAENLGISYTELQSYDQFKQTANTLLQLNKIDSKPVEITLTDAQTMDTIAK